MKSLKSAAMLAAALALVPALAFAQTSGAGNTSTTGQAKKPSLLQRRRSHMPAHNSTSGGQTMHTNTAAPSPGGAASTGVPGGPVGQIIGNKRDHVYHLPGDKNLPAPQNRVYFHSESEAVANGYHKAGTPHANGQSGRRVASRKTAHPASIHRSGRASSSGGANANTGTAHPSPATPGH